MPFNFQPTTFSTKMQYNQPCKYSRLWLYCLKSYTKVKIICLFIISSICLFTQLLVYSLIYLFKYLFIYSFIYLYTYLFIYFVYDTFWIGPILFKYCDWNCSHFILVQVSPNAFASNYCLGRIFKIKKILWKIRCQYGQPYFSVSNEDYFHLKELGNFIQELFLCPPQK